MAGVADSILCRIHHDFERMPEPNECRASIRVCRRCRAVQRFTPHGGFSGHWMDCRPHRDGYDFIDPWMNRHVEKFIAEVCGP